MTIDDLEKTGVDTACETRVRLNQGANDGHRCRVYVIHNLNSVRIGDRNSR